MKDQRLLRNKKILLIANSSFYLYKFRKSLIRSFIAEGYHVTLLSPKDEYISNLIDFHHVELKKLDRKSMNPIKDLLLLFELYHKIKKEKADIVFSFTIKPNIYSALICKLLNINIIPSITGLGYLFIQNDKKLIHKLIKRLYSYALKIPKLFIFQNMDDQKLFVDKFKVDASKCIITPGSGIDLNAIRRELMPKMNKFLMIARLLKDKGLLEFISAAEIVSKTYTDVEFILIGPIDERNPAGLSLNEFEVLNKKNVVKYLGEKKDVMPFIRECNCFVLPSYREGTPRTNLEAMAIGRPIITTDVPGCRGTVDEGQNGLLVTSRDEYALADAMIRFIKLPYKKKQELGHNSRLKAEKEFDEKIVIDKYLDIAQKVLNENNVSS